MYNDNHGALHLRGMNMLYEAMREGLDGHRTVIVSRDDGTWWNTRDCLDSEAAVERLFGHSSEVEGLLRGFLVRLLCSPAFAETAGQTATCGLVRCR